MNNYSINQSKIALALSGGVDSAVSAYLLKQQGYNPTAVYLQCWHMPGCRAEQDRHDAFKIALQLKMPFEVLDFTQQYQERVMAYFLAEYRAGRTPNPDVLCNQVIKFGLFYAWALEHGFEFIATGHYAQVGKVKINNNSGSALLTSKDLQKDQTYFLHQVQQQQLSHILFPVGHLLKNEVRLLAQQASLHVAQKKDSVGICFVGDINVQNFLKDNLGEKLGEIITADGKTIGQHQGIWFYTVGQRHGFNLDIKLVKKYTNWLDKTGNIPPLYVIKRDPDKNQIVVGSQLQTETKTFQVAKLHKIIPEIDWGGVPLQVRIRHTGKLVDCKLQLNKSKLMVTTSQPLQGVAEGQFAVFYTEEFSVKKTACHDKTKARYLCLGGGMIV